MENEFPPMASRGPAVSEAAVAKFERAIGATLPDDYRRFILAINGGRTEDSHRAFKFRRDDVANLNAIRALEGEPPMLALSDWKPDWIPAELHPIASATGGVVAICLRGEHRGSIWYLDQIDARPEGSNPRVAWHDRRDFHRVADSFAAFMAALTPL